MDLTKKLLLFFLLFYFSFFYFHKINLIATDTGRHIKNGEVVLSDFKVLSSNYYSYTQPGYFFVNHHWGFGLISWVVWKTGGFGLLSFGFALLSILTFFLAFKESEKRASFAITFLISLFIFHLVTTRTEIRPENFSYLFFILLFLILNKFKDNKLSFTKSFFFLLIVQVLWSNTHLFFVLGPFLTFLFFIESAISKSKLKKEFLVLLTGSAFASLINPSFIYGFLEPLNIFREYGYMVAENQSVIFMQKRFGDFIYLQFEALFILGVLSFLPLLKKNFKDVFVNLILFAFFGLLAWKINRMVAFFGLIYLLIIPNNLFIFLKRYKWDSYLPKTSHLAGLLFSIVFFSLVSNSKYNPFIRGIGFGLENEAGGSAKFYLDNNLKGPIFNNYDIGSYLIYSLFPKERVFIDNRPEAYSPRFIQDVYVRSQEEEDVWNRVQKEYEFNVIYFYRRDITPWAQPFLIERVKDSNWIPVYVDNYTIILVKNSDINKEVIEKYKLPPDIFIVS